MHLAFVWLQIVWTVFLSITTHSDEDTNACLIVPSNIAEAVAYSACWLQWSRVNVDYWGLH